MVGCSAYFPKFHCRGEARFSLNHISGATASRQHLAVRTGDAVQARISPMFAVVCVVISQIAFGVAPARVQTASLPVEAQATAGAPAQDRPTGPGGISIAELLLPDGTLDTTRGDAARACRACRRNAEILPRGGELRALDREANAVRLPQQSRKLTPQPSRLERSASSAKS